jgi:hypothetical protein
MTAVDVTTIPLSSADETRLVELENTITTGLATFIEVGQALAEINGEKLYRATHDTFEAYVKEQFGISRARSYQLIDAAAVSTIVDVRNEAQARELAGLDPVSAAAVHAAAVEASGSARPTAKELGDARDDLGVRQDRGAGVRPRTGPSVPPVEPRPQRPRRRRPLPDAFRDLMYESKQKIDSLQRLTVDQRFPKHAKTLATGQLSDVERMISSLTSIAAALGSRPANVMMQNLSVDRATFDDALMAAKEDGDLTHEHLAEVIAEVQAGQRRPELITTARDIVKDAQLLTERLSRLRNDDRYPAEIDQIDATAGKVLANLSIQADAMLEEMVVAAQVDDFARNSAGPVIS